MAWMKIDEKVREHPKLIEAVRKAGGSAGWFWLCGLAYSRSQSTDGFLSYGILSVIAPGMKAWKKFPQVLVDHNLWTRVEGGYQIRDYFDWNPSKAELAKAKADDAARKAAARAAQRGESPDGHETDSSDVSERTPPKSPVPRADAGASSPSSLPLESDLRSSERGPGETTIVNTLTVPSRDSVVSRAAALGLVRPGQWERQHASHAFRGDFCGWLCLPQSLVDGFVQRAVAAGFEHTAATANVRMWALGVRDRYLKSGHIPGEADIFVFWRNEWTTSHGSNTPTRSAAATDPLAGVREAERRG